MPPSQDTQTRGAATVPILNDRGFDQFGIGPLAREFQLRAGIWPTVPKPSAPISRSAYGGGRPDPIVVNADVAGLATRQELVEVWAEVNAIGDAVLVLERKAAAA